MKNRDTSENHSSTSSIKNKEFDPQELKNNLNNLKKNLIEDNDETEINPDNQNLSNNKPSIENAL